MVKHPFGVNLYKENNMANNNEEQLSITQVFEKSADDLMSHFTDMYTQVHGPDTTREGYQTAKNWYDPAYYKRLDDEFGDEPNVLSQIRQSAQKQAVDYMDELNYMLEERASRESPLTSYGIKEPEKGEGLMALLQRLLPGGKTGYK